MDFDDEGGQKDVSVLRDICNTMDIPFALERSQSGNGAHLWFFFKEQISAATVRKFGTLLLTQLIRLLSKAAKRSCSIHQP
ncbi:TOTE conflict system archaeo-eukaryotic primase domain-containing protein [Desulfitibacter alkalitolerans]|uniref:TOTE conflict system archaeo-eukaryotic primase domain-containing protein n=1 Tax=Desulfitibacter alkalitolerans TaxID=264641 RepID=UPI000480EDEE